MPTIALHGGDDGLAAPRRDHRRRARDPAEARRQAHRRRRRPLPAAREARRGGLGAALPTCSPRRNSWNQRAFPFLGAAGRVLGALTPIPTSSIVDGLPGPLSAMTIPAVRVPADAGRNVTRMAHLFPGETGLSRQSVAATAKSFGCAPDSVTEILRAARRRCSSRCNSSARLRTPCDAPQSSRCRPRQSGPRRLFASWRAARLRLAHPRPVAATT